MNSETGKVYHGAVEIERARSRGEKLVTISQRAAKLLGLGRAKRVQQLRRQRKLQKAKTVAER